MTNPNPFAVAAALTKQADTGPAGFALQNATPTILSWTVPNDGNTHMITVAAELNVTLLQTGGSVVINVPGPDGANHQRSMFAGGLAAGFNFFANQFLVQAGQTVTIVENAAQTAGAALLYAQIWGL